MNTRHLILGLVVFITGFVLAQEPVTVGVSWSNFQEERWKSDEAAMKERLEELGAEYISADAQSSVAKQLSDIESLITRGADVLIILAEDNEAVLPAVRSAVAQGIPVIGYDRLLEAEGVFYITFDNVEIGRMQARAIQALQPEGNYVFIKGSPQDPNSDFLHQGQLEVLQGAIDSGAITVVGEQYTDNWLPENANRNMEQILTANNNEVDAVVASNDGTAGGVIAALSAQGLAGEVPVSGQDADEAALKRIASGSQAQTVWVDVRASGRTAAEIAVKLARGEEITEAEFPKLTRWDEGPQGVTVDAILLDPVSITRDNLGLLIEEGWIGQETLCEGVEGDAPPACQ